MLDNLLNTMKKGAEKVQRRGEEVAQIARLKMEIFQLTRELDGHYARLGRAYHDGKDVDILGGIREDIRHTEEEIKGRERLITELGDTPDPRPETGSIQRADRATSATPASPPFTHETPATPGNQPPFTNTAPDPSTRGDKDGTDKGDLRL